jgi:hypothetical protein
VIWFADGVKISTTPVAPNTYNDAAEPIAAVREAIRESEHF